MARAVISSIDELTNMISEENFHSETVNSKVKCIRRELGVLRSFLEEADIEEVTRKLQEIIHSAEDVIVKYVLKTGEPRRRKPLFKRYTQWKDFGARNKFFKKIDEILESITRLESAQGLNPTLEEPSIHYSKGKSFHLGATLSEWIHSSVDFDGAEENLSTIVGLRQHDMESLKAQLLGNHNHSTVISILGVRGIGKTMLAWEIYKSSLVVEHFQCKAWVCISAMDNDLSEVLKDICKQTKDEFWQNKKYLIVIDGISDPQVGRELRTKILEGGPDGCRIILTTRDVEVASSADYSLRLKVLRKEESWELFRRKVFIASWQLGNASGNNNSHRLKVPSKTESWDLLRRKVFIPPWQLSNASGNMDTTEESPIPTLPPKLVSLGKEMVEKCGGIPYLIIELANLLSTVYANTLEWASVLHGLDTRLSHDHHPWFNLASYVYDVLPLHVKLFLKFLHQFPRETEIPERRLIRSSGIEDLWEQSNCVISGDKAKAAMWLLQDLQDLNLIQAVKVSSVGMTKTYCIPSGLHPLLQILKAGHVEYSSSGQVHDHGSVWIHRLVDYCDEDPHSRHVHSNTNSPEEVEPYKNLRFFWCFDYPVGYKPGQEVGNFLSSCISNNYLWFLRVLDLEGVYKPTLPEAMGELINLRYLGLRWTFLDTLPSSISNLQNLQTLDTKHTEIGDYPMIRNMKRLLHLYLNDWHPGERITQLSYLTGLQTLSGVIVDDSSLVKDGLDKLTNLTKLRMTSRLNDQKRKAATAKWNGKTEHRLKHHKEAMAEWIGKLKNLQTLKLTSKEQGDQSGKPALSILLGKLENRQLSRISLRGRLEKLECHDEFGLNLTALTLSLAQLITDPMPILERLPKLKLLRLFSKSFIGRSMHCSSKGFYQLRVLKIWNLEKLEEWTMEDGAMPKIEELEIRSCNNLKMLPNHIPKALHELKLTAMPKGFTGNIVTGKDSEKVAHVSSVLTEDWIGSIDTCAELYSGRNCIIHQGQLRKLFDIEGFTVNLTDLTLSQTKLEEDPMPVLEKLPKLRVLILSAKSFTGKVIVCKKDSFKELRQLTIRELEDLEELTVEDGAMQIIEELEIGSCKNLKVLSQVPGTLKKFKLTKMPKEFTEKYKSDKRVVIEDQ